MMKSLLELYKQNRSTYLDTDKEDPSHKYISKCYDNLFQKYRDKKINLLEIGVASGGSLLLWKDYFKDAIIFGCDIGASFDRRFNDCINNVKNIPNITLIEMDAYNNLEILNTIPNLDIVIDDGPHTKESHLKCFELYLPKLNSGGVLIIEDIGDITWTEEYITKLTAEYTYRIIDTGTELEYNSLLFVVEKL